MSKDNPNTKSTVVERMLPHIEKCRDLDAGSDRIQDAQEQYLPRHPAEESANYQIRLKRPVYVNFMSRTVDGLTGMVFRRDPQLAEDVPPAIQGHWENIDNAGTHGALFCKNVMRDATLAGHSVIMVDAPAVPRGLNLAEERALNIRPYWVRYAPEDVVNFKTELIAGQTVLTRITLRVTSYEDDGKFGDKEVTRYKTFERGAGSVTWTLYEEVKNEQDQSQGWVVVNEGTLGNQVEIPVAFAYGKQVGPYVSRPPLEPLADLNILHYQTNADYYHAMHIADVPVPVIVGADSSKKVTLGPNTMLTLPEGGDAKWMETQGAALGHTRQALEDLKGEMATLGLNFLSPDKRAAETAESKRIDKAESDSSLSQIARSVEDAVEQCLGYHAKYMRLESGGSVEVNKDYEDQSLTPDEIRAYSDMVAAGQLSLDTMWKMLEQGEWLPPDFDPEVERTNLEAPEIPFTLESA